MNPWGGLALLPGWFAICAIICIVVVVLVLAAVKAGAHGEDDETGEYRHDGE